jgi:hypothetical protein
MHFWLLIGILRVDIFASCFGRVFILAAFRSIKGATLPIEHVLFSLYGDRLLYRGISNPYTTIITDVPRQDTTITFQFVGCTDYNGNNYATVQIGRQIWMAENLKSSHYSDGAPIEFLNYANDAANAGVYGRIYTPAAARRNAASSTTNPSNVKGTAPNGWHIPSKAEWMELVTYLGG